MVFCFIDDETSSIASTDSGNSSYSRWKKRTIKDASHTNTPETETETDHSSMEEENAKGYTLEESRTDGGEDIVCNEEEENKAEEEDDEEGNESPKVHENEPPDKGKLAYHNPREEDEEEEEVEERGEGEEEEEIEPDGDAFVVSKDHLDNIKEDDSPSGLNGELESEKGQMNLKYSLEAIKKESTKSSPSSNESNPDKVPDVDVNLNKKEVDSLSSLITTVSGKSKESLDNITDENVSVDGKNGSTPHELEESTKANLKTNTNNAMKVVKITQPKLKESNSVGDEKIASVTLKPKVSDSENIQSDSVISTQNEENGEKDNESKVEKKALQESQEDPKDVRPEKAQLVENKAREKCVEKEGIDNKNDSSTKCCLTKKKELENVDSKGDLSSEITSNFLDSVDENIRNLERINELLLKEEMNEDSEPAKEGGIDNSLDSQKEPEETSLKEIQNKSFNGKYADSSGNSEMNSSPNSHLEAKEGSVNAKNTPEKSKDENKSKNYEETQRKSTLDEMMDDDYFQGFLDEINLRKKVETYQKIIKNAQMRSPDENAEEEMTSENNTDDDDKGDKEKETDKMDFEANTFSEQLMTNSSLTIGKVSLPKSIKIQKMSSSRHSSYDEDFGTTTKCPLPSVNIRSVLVTGKTGEDDKKEESDNDDDDDDTSNDKVIKDDEFISKEATSSIIDFQDYANKIFHNITISSKSMAGEKESFNPGSKKEESYSKDKQVSNTPSSSSSSEEKGKSNQNNNEKENKDKKESKEEEVSKMAATLLEKSPSVEDSLDVAKDTSDSESLMEAVRLVKKIGNIAIKRVDGQTLEHSSGSDRVTISVASSSSNISTTGTTKSDIKESSVSKTRTTTTTTTTTTALTNMKRPEKRSSTDNPLMGIGNSVSVTKASEKDKEKEKEREKEKVKMPSGVDTTRLSPSISIIPVASSSSSTTSNEKTRGRLSPTPVPASTPQSSSITTPTTTMTTVFSSSASPGFSMGSTTPSSSISASPSIPPPPLLSHSLPSPTGANVRGLIPPVPGMGLGAGPRTPITSPGLRMMGQPGMLMGNRHAGPPLARHLPPEAGPLSAELNKHSHKLAEMMRNSLEEVLGGLIGVGTPEARLAALQLELERCNWRHQQELIEVRHNADVMLVEMRANLEAEKQRAVDEARRQMEQKLAEIRRQMEVQMAEKIAEMRRQADIEKQRAIEETKKKQWCANCGKEALFFCCWNTSYCDYPCQVCKKKTSQQF